VSDFGVRFKSDLYDLLMKELFDIPEKLLNADKLKVLRQNNILNNYPANLNSLTYYMGSHIALYVPARIPPIRLNLDKTLIGEMEEYFADQEEIADEKHVIGAYLRRVLNVSDARQHLKILLPDTLYAYVPMNLIMGINPKPIDPEVLQHFKEFETKPRDMIKVRLLTNLILK